MFLCAPRAPEMDSAVNRGPEKECGPREESHQKDGAVEPERLDVLEFGSEVALDIVFDDEYAEEIRIALGAQNVPGKSSETEGRDGSRMKQTQSVAPAFGE